MLRGTFEGPIRDRRLARRRLGTAVLLVLGVAAVGEFGHQLLDRLGQAVAHHWFHIVFGAAAALVFVTWIVRDVRRNGWPRFSWRLHPHGRPEA